VNSRNTLTLYTAETQKVSIAM